MKRDTCYNFRARYHKYKGRYADVIKAYTDLQSENAKVKNVMQQTQVQVCSWSGAAVNFLYDAVKVLWNACPINGLHHIRPFLMDYFKNCRFLKHGLTVLLFQDKALRRISELREQCQLEQNAKRHLEEELRSDMEEKEHIIKALQVSVFFHHVRLN